MTILKTYRIVLPLSAVLILFAMPNGANAQLAIAQVIKAGVKKVIKAVDLKVQRLQNKTIWLQNAQQLIENELSKFKLDEISEWTERQRLLYAGYYQELQQVKMVISTYQRIGELAKLQGDMLTEYQWAIGKFKRDQHFTADELNYIEEVFDGILDHSLKNIDQIFVVVNSFKTQMSDAARLALIDAAAEKMEMNYHDLRQFSRQFIALSIQRAKSDQELRTLKLMYEIK
jgi:hypothetical protein